MNKTVGQLLKEIRIANNLTQKKFADKFYLTEKAVSNYETGKRKPDIDFIRTVCKEFNVSLDYFAMENRESDTNNLIVVRRNGKCALFDSGQSAYLTQFLYDMILITPLNKHILTRWGKDNSIIYSAFVDNKGEITEINNFIFGHRGILTIADTIMAYNMKNKKGYIINSKGKKLSSGYKNIIPTDRSSIITMYFATDEDDKIYLLDMYGQKTNYKVSKDYMISINTLDEVADFISNYGDIKYLGHLFYDRLPFYRIAIESFIKFITKYQSKISKRILFETIKNFIEELTSFANGVKINNVPEDDLKFYKEFSIEQAVNKLFTNRIERSSIRISKVSLDKKLGIEGEFYMQKC